MECCEKNSNGTSISSCYSCSLLTIGFFPSHICKSIKAKTNNCITYINTILAYKAPSYKFSLQNRDISPFFFKSPANSSSHFLLSYISSLYGDSGTVHAAIKTVSKNANIAAVSWKDVKAF